MQCDVVRRSVVRCGAVRWGMACGVKLHMPPDASDYNLRLKQQLESQLRTQPRERTEGEHLTDVKHGAVVVDPNERTHLGSNRGMRLKTRAPDPYLHLKDSSLA